MTELRKSGGSLRYNFAELDGWMRRLEHEYGYNTLRRLVASGVKTNPSPSLDGTYKAWAATVPIPKDVPDIPFFALQYMAYRFMQTEGFAPADQAKHESIPVQAVQKQPVSEL